MKRQTFWMMIAIALAAMALSCADQRAANKQADAGIVATAEGTAEPEGFQFDGAIARIDAENGFIMVEHWPLAKTFRVPEDCEIDISTNANVTLAQLRVNDPVAVTYTEVGKELVANRIVKRGKAYAEDQRERMERLYEMLNPSPNQ
jgi:hypothetical protein